VVFFYGGSWTSGERADYKFVGEALASRGIVAVVADYRLSPEVRYPVFLMDSAEAVQCALANAERWGASPEQVYLMGHSAGGYNAAMLALDSRWLRSAGAERGQIAGWIGLAGAYDFLPIGIPEVQQAFNWPGTPADSQPLFHARHPDAATPPRVLLLAARDDGLVNPQRNTQGLALALRARGQTVETAFYEGVGHATLIGAMAGPLRGLAPVLERVRQFVETRPS
jgi:acetyl esterase/lipase